MTILIRNLLILATSLFSFNALSAPQWVEKPVQCASPQEVFTKLDKDGLLPLLGATGNARVGNNLYVKNYGFLYNEENNYWAFIEFFDNETICVIVVGEGVEFDMTPKNGNK